MNGSQQAARWFRTLKGQSQPRLRLLCFPHAGGAASFFRFWVPLMPDDIELLAVRYPGREDRIRDPFPDSMEDLLEPLADACSALDDAPLVMFGHSMGAAIAYETSLRLQKKYGMKTAHLFVSGREGPGREAPSALAEAPTSDLIGEVSRLGGTDAQVIADPDLQDLLLPAIRADYRILEEHTPTAGTTLDAPVVAYYGASDPDLDAESVSAWANVPRSEFDMRVFEGGHFYLSEYREELLQDLLPRLR